MPLFVSCANLAQILCAFVKKWQDDIQSEFCTTGAWSVMWILPKLCHTDDAYYQGFPLSDFTHFEIQIQQNLPTLNPLKGAFIVKLNKSTNTHSRIKNTSRDQTSSDFRWVSQSIEQIAKQSFSIHETGEKYFLRNLNIWPHEKLAQFDRCVASSFHTSQIIYTATAAKLCRSQMFYSLEAHTHKLTLVLNYVPVTN